MGTPSVLTARTLRSRTSHPTSIAFEKRDADFLSPSVLLLCKQGPSVPFGFKSPLPLPLPAPFSPNQSRQILQPHHAAPMSPAPPVYPIYEGPPIIAEVDMPSDEDWEVWKTTDAREGIVDMLDAEGDIPP